VYSILEEYPVIECIRRIFAYECARALMIAHQWLRRTGRLDIDARLCVCQFMHVAVEHVTHGEHSDTDTVALLIVSTARPRDAAEQQRTKR